MTPINFGGSIYISTYYDEFFKGNNADDA